MLRRPEPEYMDISAEAKAYAEADFVEVNEAFVARLLELVGICDRACALDLGTGPGDIPRRVVRDRTGWRVVAADASFPMLTYARRAAVKASNPRAVLPVQTDAKTCPFPAAVFDVIFSNSIVHHITEVDLLWGEVKRVGKPRAFVLLRDLARPANPEAAREIVRTYAGQEPRLLQEEYYRSLLSAYTPEEVRAQLDAAGLTTLGVTMISDRHWDVFGRLPGPTQPD